MTNRCEELVKTLAVETSCEGASRICEKIGITVSGDTIIGMLKKEAEKINVDEMPGKITSIGVDDFAYRKGRTYCTVVCDGESHRPIEVLEGRDGESLKEWLTVKKRHMDVKSVTRDRASAYAKVISDILPEAMQVADRFHLHQNLLDAVKEALKTVIPNEIPVPNDYRLSLENNETLETQSGENNIFGKELAFCLDKTEANTLEESAGNFYSEEIDEPKRSTATNTQDNYSELRSGVTATDKKN